MSALRLTMNSRDVLSQPSLWFDEDITAALRRALESQRLGGAENLIRGEAIRFMQQQRTEEQGSKWDMVVFEQNEQPSQPESSSSEPSSTKKSKNIVEEIMMKWGLKKINHPPIVIAKPIPSSSGETLETSASEQSSAPPPPSKPASAPPPSTQLNSVTQGRRQLPENVPRRVPPPLSQLRVRKRPHQTNLSKKLQLSKLSKQSPQYKPFQS